MKYPTLAVGLGHAACAGALALGCNAIFGIEELRPRHIDPKQGERDAATPTTAVRDAQGDAPSSSDAVNGNDPPDSADTPQAGIDAAEGDGEPSRAPSDAPSAPDATPSDSAQPEADVIVAEAGRACAPAQWPEPPAETSTNPQITANIDFVVAMRSIDLGDAPDGGSQTSLNIGFDLDGRCTAPGLDPGSCQPPAGAAPNLDGENGIDNALGQFFRETHALLGRRPSTVYNELIAQGIVSLLLRVRGYNGLPNDSRVELGFYSPGPRIGAGGPIPPEWTGEDVWPIIAESLESLPQSDGGIAFDINRPLASDPNAYVTDGILVADVPSAALQVPSAIVYPPGQMMSIKISGAVVVGRLVNTQDGWEIRDATLAGRWKIEDLFGQMSQFPSRIDATNRTPLCMNLADYDGWKNKFCPLVDILSGLGTSNKPCDALSVGIRFDTAAARLGPIVSLPAFPPRCPAEHDPATDSCASE